MPLKMFPCVLIACFAFSLLAATATAQTPATLPRQATTGTDASGVARLETDPVIISLAQAPDSASSATPAALNSQRLMEFNQLLLAAIDNRLGARYVWGAAGPHAFDCSGFVWSAFQSVGINFERVSARSLWARFAPAHAEEETKFGTLVFFNNLTHVGIVADEHGFYHASRTHGVVYSPFKGYWESHIDGFRRVPRPEQLLAD